MGDMDPARAQARWRDYAEPFLKDYVHFFAASGEKYSLWPFNGLPFRALLLRSGSRTTAVVNAVAPGLSRRLCTKNLTFFTDRPARRSAAQPGLDR